MWNIWCWILTVISSGGAWHTESGEVVSRPTIVLPKLKQRLNIIFRGKFGFVRISSYIRARSTPRNNYVRPRKLHAIALFPEITALPQHTYNGWPKFARNETNLKSRRTYRLLVCYESSTHKQAMFRSYSILAEVASCFRATFTNYNYVIPRDERTGRQKHIKRDTRTQKAKGIS